MSTKAIADAPLPILEQSAVEGAMIHVDHPRNYGFVPGPSNYVGVLGDLLAFNPAHAAARALLGRLREAQGRPDEAAKGSRGFSLWSRTSFDQSRRRASPRRLWMAPASHAIKAAVAA